MVETRLLSSLDKVFHYDAPEESPLVLQTLQNETLSFQLAFRTEERGHK